MLSKKNWLSIQFFEIFHSCAFYDEIYVENFKKVVKKLIEGVRIWTPVTLTFFMINPN
jgi:hypothetical protein